MPMAGAKGAGSSCVTVGLFLRHSPGHDADVAPLAPQPWPISGPVKPENSHYSSGDTCSGDGKH